MDSGRYEIREGSALHGQAPSILLIDDAPDEIRGTLNLLRAQPWRLSVAGGALQGYQRALALRPNLIVLDVHMPQMDGFTLCRLLREAPPTRQTPILFLSSANTPIERLEGLTLGGVDYIPKACEPEEVLARIRIHLQLTWREPPANQADQTGETGLGADQIVLRAAMRLIEQQLNEMPSLAEISRKVGTHEKRLSVIFRQHLGLTVFGYVRDARLRRGQELLADSRVSIQDIADMIGFRSACNFTTAFRQRLGLTPSQFRQQAQGTASAESARRA